MQNEMIKIIALRIVSDLAEGIRKNGYFSLMADECTDISNKEQLARHVDHNLVAHEEFFGFYHIPNIFSDDIVSVIKDVQLRMNQSLFKCRGQCYDGAGTMAGCRNGVAAQLLV